MMRQGFTPARRRHCACRNGLVQPARNRHGFDIDCIGWNLCLQVTVLVAARVVLSRSTAAVSIAAINSIGNLGGFVGPYGIGYIKDATGSAYAGLLFLSGLLFVAFVMTWFARMTNAPVASSSVAQAHA
jgi:nitrate/nitrite transporter NarK